MLRITITRRESFDPLSVIEQATRQAVAQQIASEHADPDDETALFWHYERDSGFEGDFVDFVISGTDERRMGLVLRRLRAHGYDDLTIEWASDDDPPHLIQVVAAEGGAPALPARAREALEALGFHVPLVRDADDGFFKTRIPATFPAESVAALGDSAWVVRVVHRA